MTQPIGDLKKCAGIDITGIGGSEGPARFLVEILSEGGLDCRFVPLSAFAANSSRKASRGLIIFSQGLSPHARWALENLANRPFVVLITAAADPEIAEVCPDFHQRHAVIRVECADEKGQLWRAVGGNAFAWAALEVAMALESIDAATVQEAERALAKTTGHEPTLAETDIQQLVIVAVAPLDSLPNSLAWRVQEALYCRPPEGAELLGLVHGPLQSFFEEPRTILALRTAHEPLSITRAWERLGDVLHPHRHRLVQWHSELPGVVAWLEHGLRWDLELLNKMEIHNIDPHSWPGKDVDRPLYELCSNTSR